jgi:outer membrane lipoprotein SlyB
METHVEYIAPESGKFPQAIIWIAGVALTLFCGVGIAAFMGWIPNSISGPGDKPAVVQQSSNAVPAVVPKAAHKPVPVHAAPVEPVAHAPAPPIPVVPAKVAAVTTCAECGVIESIREIDAKGKGSGIGAVGGAVLGGLLGNQVGAGRGKDVMTVVGAVGGGLAGNEAEKRIKTSKSYEVTVRFNDGSSRVISEAGLPAWHTGDKVKIVNGAIQSNA